MKASAKAARLHAPLLRSVGISPSWRIFAESKMGPQTIAIGNIPAHEPAQMLLSKDDRMISAFPSDRPDYSFGKRVLPRRAGGRDDVLQRC